MAETISRNPWDEEVDSGAGWTDQLVTQWGGKAVYCTRNIASPEEQTEFWRVVFPDGSRLFVGIDSRDFVHRETGACETDHWNEPKSCTCTKHWAEVEDSAATKASAGWLKALYDNTSIRELDTDL